MSFQSRSMKEWVNNSIEHGDKENFNIALDIFLNRFSPFVLDDPFDGAISFLRIFRTGALLLSNGQIKTSENLFIRDIDNFHTDSEIRKDCILSNSWDNKSTFLSEKKQHSKMRQEEILLDWSGEKFLKNELIEQQIKQFEYILNIVFKEKDVIFLENRKYHRCLTGKYLNDFTNLYYDFLSQRVPETLDYFRCQLSNDIMKLFDKTNESGIIVYNWLAGKKSAFHQVSDPDIDISKMRIQAVSSYPILYNLFTSSQHDFSSIIDKAQKLNEPLSEFFNATTKVIKNANGLSYDAIGAKTTINIEMMNNIINQVSYMPDGKKPSNTMEWQNYFLLLDIISQIGYNVKGILKPQDNFYYISKSQEEQDIEIKNLMSSFSGKWSNLNNLECTRIVNDVKDCISDFHNNVMFPARNIFNVESWELDDTIGLILRGKKLDEIIKFTKWWHEERVEIRNYLVAQYPFRKEDFVNDFWEPLHENKDLKIDNIFIVPLISKQDLNDEHIRMQHCVDTYANQCLYNRRHIISFRDESYDSIATAEINFDLLKRIIKKDIDISNRAKESLHECIIQYRGKGNTSPSLEAYETLWLYLEGISKGSIKVDVDKIENRYSILSLGNKDKRHDENIIRTYYNYNIEGALLNAWKLFSPMMSKSVAKKGPIAMKEYIESKKEKNNYDESNTYGMNM